MHRGIFPWGIKGVGSEAHYCQRAFYFLPRQFLVFFWWSHHPQEQKRWPQNCAASTFVRGTEWFCRGCRGENHPHPVPEHLPTLRKGQEGSCLSSPRCSDGCSAALGLPGNFVKTKMSDGNSGDTSERNRLPPRK